MKGEVNVFSDEKPYGFALNNYGHPVFFHLSDVKESDREDIFIGQFIEFDEIPTPKGLKAENISVIESFAMLIEPEKTFLVSKHDEIGDDYHTVLNKGRIVVEGTNPNEAFDKLRNLTHSAGCNAILNYRKERRNGTSWLNSNYEYTIFVLAADIALVKEIVYTYDEEEAKSNISDVEQEVAAMSSRPKPCGTAVNDASGFYSGISTLIVITVVVIAISLFFRY